MNKAPSFCILLMLPLLLVQCRPKAHIENDPTRPTTEQVNGAEYDSTAEGYESEDRVIWQKPDLVIERLGEIEGKTIADLGAGTGYFSRRMAYKGARVIAIDIDPKAIRWMEEQKARFPVELRDRLIIRLAEPDDPKLLEREVDHVILVNTYTYIDSRVEYFSQLLKAVRPGGSILVIDFKKEATPFGPDVEDRLDQETVVAELQDAGWSIADTDTTTLEYQYIIRANR